MATSLSINLLSVLSSILITAVENEKLAASSKRIYLDIERDYHLLGGFKVDLFEYKKTFLKCHEFCGASSSRVVMIDTGSKMSDVIYMFDPMHDAVRKSGYRKCEDYRIWLDGYLDSETEVWKWPNNKIISKFLWCDGYPKTPSKWVQTYSRGYGEDCIGLRCGAQWTWCLVNQDCNTLCQCFCEKYSPLPPQVLRIRPRPFVLPPLYMNNTLYEFPKQFLNSVSNRPF